MNFGSSSPLGGALSYPKARPQYDLNLIRNKFIPPEYTFTRNSAGTYVGADGYIKTAAANEPRFDYDPVTGEFKGLLVEESRTNFYTTSETMTSGRTFFQTRYIDFTIGGPQNGRFIRVVRDRSLPPVPGYDWQYDIFYSNTGLSNGAKFAVSFYARCPNGTLNSIRLSNPDAEGEVFNIDSTWRRFTKVFTYGTQSGLTFFRFNRSHSPSNVDGATYDLAALQVERLPTPSSYIPTSGSTVTRQADQLILNRPLNLNGTFYFESSIANLKDQQTLLTADNDTDRLIVKNDNGNLYQSVNNVTISSTAPIDTESTKRLITTDSGKYIFTSSSNTESSIHQRILNYSTTYNNLSLGFDPQNSNRELNGYIKKFSYYPQSISENQSQSLTNDKQPLNYISSVLFGGDDVYQINIDGQNYIVHRFLTTGTSNLIVPIDTEVEYLIVGGGGGGGSSIGGGGGAGEFIEGSKILSSLNYPVIVGNGGGIAVNGANSSAFSITAIGGGGGGANGGSGGGGTFNGGGGLSIATIGFGNAGSAGSGSGATAAGGGGGGAGSTGFAPTPDIGGGGSASSNGGAGGTGRQSLITGFAQFYAAGGAGGQNNFEPQGLGGSGIGGNGANNVSGSRFSTPGASNTGSGGGGGGNLSANATKIASPGGSGIVIIRYKV